MGGQRLGPKVRLPGVTLRPGLAIALAMSLGFVAGNLVFVLPTWDWLEPAYQATVAWVLFVLALDRFRGAEISAHPLTLLYGIFLAYATFVYKLTGLGFELVTEFLPDDQLVFLSFVVPVVLLAATTLGIRHVLGVWLGDAIDSAFAPSEKPHKQSDPESS
jgi:hypothetical protein